MSRINENSPVFMEYVHARNIVCSRNLLDILISKHGTEKDVEPAEAPSVKPAAAVSQPSPPRPVIAPPPCNFEPMWWHTMWFGGLVDLEAPLPGEPITVRFIQSVVAKAYGVTRQNIISSRRVHHFSLPRQIAMFLTKTLLDRSYHDISRRFGNRDHATAIYSVRKISARCASDPEFAIRIAELKAEILA